MNIQKSIVMVYLITVIVLFNNCKKNENTISAKAAIQIADNPRAVYDNNMSGDELQVHLRVMILLHHYHYQYKESHAVIWERYLCDENRDIYGRFVAAYFLLDKKQSAQKFILTHIASNNFSYRYNAAETLKLNINGDASKKWAIDLLIKALANGALEEVNLTKNLRKFKRGDNVDLGTAPLEEVCYQMGFMKVSRAVPALISVLERGPSSYGAAFALGEIGDKRALPILLKIAKDRTGYGNSEINALGKLKSKEALPILLSHIYHPRSTFSGLDVIETESILIALLNIGDPSAIEPIEEYLNGEYPKKSKATARRVLVQLKSTRPVESLITLLEEETYEPERRDIIDDLVKYADARVVKVFANLARNSDSAFMRREAIFGLKKIGDQQSLLILASLLNHTYPDTLKVELGWKMAPKFQAYFLEILQDSLKNCTKQDFGKDQKKWEDWILNNTKPIN